MNVPTDGAAILERVEEYVGRFVAYPSEHARIAHVLWIAHTHAMDAWDSTPRIAFISPEPGSGKTRALEVTENLVPRPIEAINTSASYLFRKISDPDGLPTILFDEIDTLFGAKAKEHEEVRGVLNAGHRRGAVAGRCVVIGKKVQTEELPAYCAVAIAGLGHLPDTLFSRSVVVRMHRRAPTERVMPYRRRDHAAEGRVLRDELAQWTGARLERLSHVRPRMPEGVEDRAADVWEPLFAIADAAGGHWPTRARTAGVVLVTDAKTSPPSLGVRLLNDIREVFGTCTEITTADLIAALSAMDEAPWGDLRGKPIDPRKLASMLKPYGVAPTTFRIGQGTAKGYRREDLYDAWARYLPPQGVTTVTGVTHADTPKPDAVTFDEFDFDRAWEMRRPIG